MWGKDILRMILPITSLYITSQWLIYSASKAKKAVLYRVAVTFTSDRFERWLLGVCYCRTEAYNSFKVNPHRFHSFLLQMYKLAPSDPAEELGRTPLVRSKWIPQSSRCIGGLLNVFYLNCVVKCWYLRWEETQKMLPGVPGSVYLTWEFAVQLLWNL